MSHTGPFWDSTGPKQQWCPDHWIGSVKIGKIGNFELIGSDIGSDNLDPKIRSTDPEVNCSYYLLVLESTELAQAEDQGEQTSG